jgi:hypothetical protein
MYLIIKTASRDGDETLTACAVVAATRETVDYVLGMMDQAALLSDKLGKTMTLTCDDWIPDFYDGYPEVDAFGPEQEQALDMADPGWCVLAERPFPAEDDRVDSREAPFPCPGAASEPVRLAYCEMCASGEEVSWACGPKERDGEEYTWAVPREVLRGLLSARTPASR